jgi:general secretion pathway protein K
MTRRLVRPFVRAGQRGAAILLALLIMTLVATLAAGMVWVQWRGIEVESAERARGQGDWLLTAALDWGNLILKSSVRNGHKEDDLGQPWAMPLAETKLSSFLSADGSHSDDGGPEAYLSGQITDAQSKYNLYNLVLPGSGKGAGSEVDRLKILCSAAGVSESVATTLAAGIRASWSAVQQAKDSGTDSSGAVLMPVQVSDLAWYGIDQQSLKLLEPFVQILPYAITVDASGNTTATATTINVNTAPAEVLMAALPGITRAQAQQIILHRQQSPLQAGGVDTAMNYSKANPYKVPDGAPARQDGVLSQYFEIYGQLRYEQHVIRERSVVYRKDAANPVQVLRRERLAPDAA